MKKLLFFLIFLVLCSFVFADFGYDNDNLPKLEPETSTGTTLTEGANYSINTNRSDYWDDLDTPDDISWITYIQKFFNQWLNTTDDVTFNSVNTTQITLGGDSISGWSEVNGSSDTRSTTLVVCASDSLDTSICNYQCDGTNDEVEINNALNALPSNGGKVVLMEGQYNFGSNLDISYHNIWLQGQGTSSYINGTIYLENSNNTIINNLRINSLWIYPNNLDMDNIIISDNYLSNLDHTRTGSTFVYNLKIYNNYFDTATINFRECPNVIFRNNYFTDSSGQAIKLRNSNGSIIDGNTFYDVTDGIVLDGSSNSLVTNNQIFSPSSRGIQILETSNVLVNGNIISDSSGDGIEFSRLVFNSIISNNRIFGSSNFEIDIDTSILGDNAGNMVLNNNLFDSDNSNTINNEGINTTIMGNFPGGSSMEIQTASGQEIKMIPEGTHTMTFNDNHTVLLNNLSDESNTVRLSFENGVMMMGITVT